MAPEEREQQSTFRVSNGTRREPNAPASEEEWKKMLGTILLVLLIIVLLGALPTWPYSSGWGYYPSSGAGILLLIVIVLLVTGRI
jgi:hypothetical protein